MLYRPFRDAGQTEPYFQALMAASNDRDTIARAAMALAFATSSGPGSPPGPISTIPRTTTRPPRDVPLYRQASLIRTTSAISALADPGGPVLGSRRHSWNGSFANTAISPGSPWAKPEVQARAAGLTLGKVAEEKLNALRTVGVGMVAPEIEGTDVDGAPLRLE